MTVENEAVAVVTGASSGIGEATAKRLAAAGYHVALMARRAEPLRALREGIEAAGGTALDCPVDASDGGAVLEVARRVCAELGVPDLIVNSAGAGTWRYIEDTPPDEAAAMLGAPYAAAYHTTHAFMARLFFRINGISPGVVRWLAASTGRRRTTPVGKRDGRDEVGDGKVTALRKPDEGAVPAEGRRRS